MRGRTPEDDYATYLETAHIAAQHALNVLYDPKSGVKRSLWDRLALGRAQSTLISLHAKELKSRKKR